MMEMLNKLTGPLDTTPKEGATNQKTDDSNGKVDMGNGSKNNGKVVADLVNNALLGYVYTHTAPYHAYPGTSGGGTYVPYGPVENPVHYDPGTFMVQQGMPTGVTEKKDDPIEENKRKLSLLEERLRGLEGSNSYYRLVDTSELSLVDGLVIPPKFKTPEFEKFDGTKDFLNNHLRSYTRKMGPYAKNEKLMIHCFQDSLAGTASIWQWKGSLLRVIQSLLNNGRIRRGEPFAKIVVIEQKLDNSIKSGRIIVADETKKGQVGKKKEEVSNVNEEPYKPYYPPPAYNYPQYGQNSANYYHPPTPVQPSYHVYGYYAPPHAHPYNYQHSGDINAVGGAPFRPRPSNPPPGSTQSAQQKAPAYLPGNTGPVKNKAPIDPIPCTYTELLPQLLQQNLLQRLPYANPLKPPLPAWYDAKAHCDYHSGTEGHKTENCWRLKYAIQGLVRSGKLSFGNMAEVNPLPDHGKAQANMVGTGEIVKQEISEITTPLDIVFKALAKAGMVEKGKFGDGELAEVCPYHGRIHGICECPEFKGKVQKLMDEYQIEFCVEG
ncbi:hypothetical protein CCACVL1_20155 [Corchorus capsularis]|uniref:Retrotransposon gag protein n=1 Tax=Corchorus capsularis TaxID=210143 RepID=A0A1R3HCH2_COCAP|nr:hypothetical protein CCACVL1_20155 [Corchorus capsularis]